MADQKAESGGIGICTILFIVFLILKLVGIINWSWWWVTSPLWIPIALLLLFLAIVFVGYLIAKIRD